MKHAFILVVWTNETDREAVKVSVQSLLDEALAGPGEEHIANMTVNAEPEDMREAIAPLIAETKRLKGGNE